MNSYSLMIVVLLLCSNVGHAMDCYKCDYGACLFPSVTSCQFGQVCMTQTASTSSLPLVSDLVTLRRKDCLSILACGSEASDTYLGVTVKATRTCCYSNLCNSAIKTSMSAVTSVALLVALCFTKLF
ncbi:hypothetical protein XENTR_v10021295 [Xenopus tropicalis]|uniref:Prostate stem cell antigen n=1 Tax=Xenopus tropicalis TaxID=8364 RepID=A0A8J0QV97_XENTR|nr:prostate stem cell antigen [Xenopus tropicalis]KAE8585373.1 hypothetical protein XENTR_v10021295 [Xenopus tropicalis]KAE8585374.1 hypothetical protein XENTR_v10021295 [Xenopus tropicalis]|eukprot:XP_002939497.1 PREDICTED: prostate stem cell antigen-like [Xenopus tropicalis]